jgi:L-iditol 2-dehydrogenase
MSTATATPEVTFSPSIPATMKAAVYRGINDVRVETVPVPEIGAGEILIKVASCGICGTDLKKIHTGSHSAPRIFGHETAGTIAAIGAGVENFRGWRAGDGLPSRSVRRLLLLPQEDLRPVPGLQASRSHRRL